MAQRILFKDSGLGNSNNPLSGYKFVGYNGLTFSQLDSDGNIVAIGGSGSGSGLNTASNGLSVLGDIVKIGGLLNQTTTIDGNGQDLNIDGLLNFSVTASQTIQFRSIDGFDVLVSNSDVNIYSGDISTYSTAIISDTSAYLKNQVASGDNSYIAAEQGQVSLEIWKGLSASWIRIPTVSESVSDGSTNNNMIIADDISAKGLVYLDDYSPNFTTYSLVTKGYVDALSFASGVSGTGTTNYVPKWTGTNTLSSTSKIYDDGTNVGINNSSPFFQLDINGSSRIKATESNYQLEIQAVSGHFYLNHQKIVGGSNNTQLTCNSVNLSGTNNISPNTFTYYNPPPPQSLINANTKVTVCFTGTHTWVSDLGFYLIGPVSCGGPVITLSPNPGSNGQNIICNSGNNFNNLCFTNNTAPNFNPCAAATPLTGTYDSYGSGGGTLINWSPLIGCNAAQGGWRVQVFDCVSLDFGTLSSATISFTNLTSICGSPTSITYSSGTINSPINDNSCSQSTGSVYQVPPLANLTTPITITGTSSTQWTSSPNVSITNNNLINTTATGISQQTTFTLTSTFSIGGTSICVSTAQTTFTPYQLNANVTSTNPVCDNACNGTATATPLTGSAPFTYVWAPSGSTQTITNLCEGTYNVTITDSFGCQTTGSVTLTDPVAPVLGPISHD